MGKYTKKEWAEETDRRYKAEYGPLAHFVQTLDGLGLDDFPERDYFLEAGRLLREAKLNLKQAASYLALHEPANSVGGQWLDLADRIDKLLAGEPSQ